MSDSHVPRETEATLVILAKRSSSISDLLTSEARVGGHELVAEGIHVIHDKYFDAPDGALSARGYALRLRDSDGRLLVALKGGGERAGQFATARLEIEGPWSQETLHAIAHELQKQGILPFQLPAYQDMTRPVEALRGLGLRSLQNRDTRRQVFAVLAEGTRMKIAEIAVDSVTYHISRIDVVHHELEVEAKNQQGVVELDRLIQALLKRFPGALRPWKHGKLATGISLAEVLKTSERQMLLRKDNSVSAMAYNLIDRHLRARSPKL